MKFEKKKLRNKNTSGLRPADIFIDTATIQLLMGRDPTYLKALFLDVNPFLVRICIANAIYDENLEDVIHQTWETFFFKLEKFEGRSQIRTFICGILFNKIREFRRVLGKVQFESDSEHLMKLPFTPDGWWNSTPHGPDRILELRQSTELIRDCLEGLTDQQKTAFILKEVEEENSEEICSVLAINISHLRVLLFRAKDKLRKCLEGRVGQEPAV